jgi:hypothetical protein
LDIERLLNEMPFIQKDFEVLINQNQWLMELINGFNQEEATPIAYYKLFMKFTDYLQEFGTLKSK